MNLNEVDLLIDAKKEQIYKLKSEIVDLKKVQLELKSGHKEGDLVETKKGERGILIFNPGFTWSWYWKKIKKDGTPSQNATYLSGEFEKVTP
ncbi:MAG: hypothetical protein ACYDG6_14585 [Thermincolia bacterium]